MFYGVFECSFCLFLPSRQLFYVYKILMKRFIWKWGSLVESEHSTDI